MPHNHHPGGHHLSRRHSNLNRELSNPLPVADNNTYWHPSGRGVNMYAGGGSFGNGPSTNYPSPPSQSYSMSHIPGGKAGFGYQQGFGYENAPQNFGIATGLVTAGENLLHQLDGHVGRREKKFFKEHGINSGEAWCANFLNEACKEGGFRGTHSTAAASFEHWGVGVRPSDVQPGDVWVRGDGHHVGIVKSVEGNTMTVIQGNYNDVAQVSVETKAGHFRRAAPGMGA